VDRADRRGVGHGGGLADVRVRRPGGRDGDLLDDAAGDRDPPVPFGSGAAPLGGHEERIRSLLRLSPPSDGFTASASVEVEGVTAELDVAGVIDVAAERRRMEKDLAAARAEAEQAERKLANAGFTAKAPAAVVDKTRQRLEVAQADIARLEQRLASI
jgi:valyl-tRNA synthetase